MFTSSTVLVQYTWPDPLSLASGGGRGGGGRGGKRQHGRGTAALRHRGPAAAWSRRHVRCCRSAPRRRRRLQYEYNCRATVRVRRRATSVARLPRTFSHFVWNPFIPPSPIPEHGLKVCELSPPDWSDQDMDSNEYQRTRCRLVPSSEKLQTNNPRAPSAVR